MNLNQVRQIIENFKRLYLPSDPNPRNKITHIHIISDPKFNNTARIKVNFIKANYWILNNQEKEKKIEDARANTPKGLRKDSRISNIREALDEYNPANLKQVSGAAKVERNKCWKEGLLDELNKLL